MENEQVITTLFEGHYQYGVAALINSIAKASFKGSIILGYKGELPTWIDQLSPYEDGYKLTDDIHLKFIKLEHIGMHMGYYKPYFLLDILKSYPLVKKVYYFDPDIIVNAPWSFYSDWVESGVALCLDMCFTFLHQTHPWRKEWMKLYAGGSRDKPVQNETVNFYVNSGFIGVSRRDSLLLERWVNITDKYIRAGKTITHFEQTTAHTPYKGDQDLLNAALTVTSETPYSVIGTEGMGFTFPAYLMYHAIGGPKKPWNRNFVTTFLSQKKPTMAETEFFKHAEHPISIFSGKTLFLKRMGLKTAKLLGRLIN